MSQLMEIIGKIFMYAGFVALIIGDIGIVFCGFKISFMRGIRNLVIPCLGFGDAMHRFPIFVWLWGGGIASIVVGFIFV